MTVHTASAQAAGALAARAIRCTLNLFDEACTTQDEGRDSETRARAASMRRGVVRSTPVVSGAVQGIIAAGTSSPVGAWQSNSVAAAAAGEACLLLHDVLLGEGGDAASLLSSSLGVQPLG